MQQTIRLLLLIIAFGLSSNSQAQTTIEVKKLDQSQFAKDLSIIFNDYQIIWLPSQKINDLADRSGNQLDMQWHMPSGDIWPLSLEVDHSPLVSESFQINLATPNGIVPYNFDFDDFHSYQSANPHESAILSIKDDFIYGSFSIKNTTWYIQPLRSFVKNCPANSYILYQAKDVIDTGDKICGTPDFPTPQQPIPSLTKSDGGCVDVLLAIAVDYSVVEFYGGEPSEFIEEFLTVFKYVNKNYKEAFCDRIRFRISEIWASTCASCDPWSDTVDGSALNQEFREWAEDGGFFEYYDMGEFWTKRDIALGTNFSVVGVASVGGICNFNRTHVLELFPDATVIQLQNLVSHESGHNFGLGHNYTMSSCADLPGRPRYIMDPSVTPSTIWSEGLFAEACDKNSVEKMNDFLVTDHCLTDCEPRCPFVRKLQIVEIDPSVPSIELDWSEGQEEFWLVTVYDNETGEVEEYYTGESNLTIDTNLDLCKNYTISVAVLCFDIPTAPYSINLDMPAETQMEIEDLTIQSCGVNGSTYDLELVVSYTNLCAQGFTVFIDGTAYNQVSTGSPQTVLIPGLPADGATDIQVQALSNCLATTPGAANCAGVADYNAPFADCMIVQAENFNDCQVPFGWTVGGTYPPEFHWIVADDTRPERNFGGPGSTFDGTCMFIFDDDLFGFNITGVAELYTKALNLADYDDIKLSLIYNFNAFKNLELPRAFRIDVFDGQNWVNVLTDITHNDCGTNSNAWNVKCFTDFETDLSAFANDQFQIRFSYDDNGQYAEFAAFDNYELVATRMMNLTNEMAGDYNGSEKSIAIINDNKWSIFPNPLSGTKTLHINYTSNNAVDTHFQLYNANGQLAKQFTWLKELEESSRALDLNDLAPGLYLLRASDGSTKKIIIND